MSKSKYIYRIPGRQNEAPHVDGLYTANDIRANNTYTPTPYRIGDDTTRSVQYNASGLFQQHEDPNFNTNLYPLATKGHLDLFEALATIRKSSGKTTFFGDNAAAVKISVPSSEPIVRAAMSERISDDPNKNSGHAERFAAAYALDEFIPERGPIPRPSDYSRSPYKNERNLEINYNLFRRAPEIKGALEYADGSIQVVSERIPCEYGSDNCRTFVNRISPNPNSKGERSNAGHTAVIEKYSDKNQQAAMVEKAYWKLQDSHKQYTHDNPPQSTTFNLPKPVSIPVSTLNRPTPNEVVSRVNTPLDSSRDNTVKTFYSQNSSSRQNSRINLEFGINSPFSDDYYSSDDSSPLNQRSTPRKNSKITDFSDFQNTSVDSPILNITNLINSPTVSSYSPTSTPSPSFDYSSDRSSSGNDYTGTPLMSNRVGYRIPGVTGDYTAAAELFKANIENLLKK